jgi:hypothetical protein
MTDHADQPRALRAAITLVACIGALSIIAPANAQAKQQCSAAANSQGYWSWRMIDGRKCWYEGKPMLSKSSLEWPVQASEQPASDGELASTPAEPRRNPLDAQARAPDDSNTFEALWQSRIEKR